MIGFQENPYPYIKNADLFVCSSLNEGYNLAISEAAILGVPVISTDCSGIKENLGNGKWGYIVENRKETLYHAISRCFDEPGFLEELKKKYGVFNNFKKTWTKEVFGTKKGLNIWNKTRTKVLKKKLPNKTKVNVMYISKGYAKVEYNGVVGYMKAKYLL